MVLNLVLVWLTIDTGSDLVSFSVKLFCSKKSVSHPAPESLLCNFKFQPIIAAQLTGQHEHKPAKRVEVEGGGGFAQVGSRISFPVLVEVTRSVVIRISGI